MALFGRFRKKRTHSEDEHVPLGEDEQPTEITRGPKDSGGQPAPKGYLDLGALYVPRVPGLQLRGKFEKGKSTLSRMLLVLGSTGITASVAAAPKSGGAWEELLGQIEGAFRAAGGEAERVEGPYGTELSVRAASVLPDGTKGFTPLRIVGVEGPRWLIRLDIQGAAVTGDTAQKDSAEQLIDGLIVNRGSEPKIRFELLPFTLPSEAALTDGDS